MTWIQDGLTDLERSALDDLVALGVLDIEHLDIAVDLPHVQLLDATGVLVIKAMNTLSHKDVLIEVLSHPVVQSAPDDAWGGLVVAAAAIREPESGTVVSFLDDARVQAGTSQTDLTPHLQVSIVRTGESKPGTLEAVFEAATVVEGIMGLPLPTSHIVLVFDDEAVPENYGGSNAGFAITYRPEYEQPTDSWKWSHLRTGLIHEIAHYFWRGNGAWINEGMANMHVFIYNLDSGLSPNQLRPKRGECEAQDIRTLEEWRPKISNKQYRCSYYMGEMLFLELRSEIGGDLFIDKMRELYTLTLSEKEAGRDMGIAQIRQVFAGHSDVVERFWSGKWNAPENRVLTEGIERKSHDLIRWDQYPTLGSDGKTVSLRATLLNDAVLVAPHISIARSGGAQNFLMYPFDSKSLAGFILPYFEDGTRWRGVPGYHSAVASTYQLEGRSFHIEFSVPDALGTPSDYVVVVTGFQNNEQEPTIGTKNDVLGYARIRQSVTER